MVWLQSKFSRCSVVHPSGLIVVTFLTFAGYMAAAKAIKGGPVAKSVKTA